VPSLLPSTAPARSTNNIWCVAGTGDSESTAPALPPHAMRSAKRATSPHLRARGWRLSQSRSGVGERDRGFFWLLSLLGCVFGFKSRLHLAIRAGQMGKTGPSIAPNKEGHHCARCAGLLERPAAYNSIIGRPTRRYQNTSLR
jgi:hypothetical protein